MNIKYFLALSIFSLVLGCSSPNDEVAERGANLNAQLADEAADASVYSFASYRKIARGERFERTALIEKYILPLMQARVDSGQILNWTLWRVAYPRGGDYDDISIASANSYSRESSGGTFQEQFEKLHGAGSMETFMNAARMQADVVKTEIWRRNLAIGATERMPYIRIFYSKTNPGMNAEHRQLRDNIWQPFVAEGIKTQGAGWSSWDLVEPGSMAAPYNMASVSSYKDFADMEPRDDFQEVWARAHPDKNWPEIRAQFRAASTVARQETWQLVFTTQ